MGLLAGTAQLLLFVRCSDSRAVTPSGSEASMHGGVVSAGTVK